MPLKDLVVRSTPVSRFRDEVVADLWQRVKDAERDVSDHRKDDAETRAYLRGVRQGLRDALTSVRSFKV